MPRTHLLVLLTWIPLPKNDSTPQILHASTQKPKHPKTTKAYATNDKHKPEAHNSKPQTRNEKPQSPNPKTSETFKLPSKHPQPRRRRSLSSGNDSGLPSSDKIPRLGRLALKVYRGVMGFVRVSWSLNPQHPKNT